RALLPGVLPGGLLDLPHLQAGQACLPVQTEPPSDSSVAPGVLETPLTAVRLDVGRETWLLGVTGEERPPLRKGVLDRGPGEQLRTAAPGRVRQGSDHHGVDHEREYAEPDDERQRAAPFSTHRSGS